MIAMDIFYFLLACAVLVSSGSFLVKTLAKISEFLRISEFAAASVIMAVATSLPELFVGVNSAISQNPALSLGNVIGANILDLTLVLGIIIITARGIKVKKVAKADSLWMTGIVILPLLLFFIGNSLSRIDGLILILIFLIYSIRTLKRRHKGKRLKDNLGRYEVLNNFSIFSISLITLFFSAHFLVKYASNIAGHFGLPPVIVGLFIISIGTTLPELTFGVRAAMLKHGDMALGNQVGTVIINSTLILGVVALIYPITANFPAFLISSVFLIIISFIFITLVSSGRSLSIKAGIFLILIYLFFMIVEFYIQSVSVS